MNTRTNVCSPSYSQRRRHIPITLGTFYRGDTFGFYAEVRDPAGEPVTVPATNLRSQVRDAKDRLWASLAVSDHPGGVVGTYFFQAPPEVTRTWPIGVLYIDIEVEVDGNISSTETFVVHVEKDITRYE